MWFCREEGPLKILATYVNQLVSSSLDLSSAQLFQHAQLGLNGSVPNRTVVAVARQTLTTIGVPNVRVMLRVPNWADGPGGGVSITIDGNRIPALPSSYVPVELATGQRLASEFGMAIRLERVTDYRTECVSSYLAAFHGGFCPQQFHSIHVGPLLMVALICELNDCQCHNPLNCTNSELILDSEASLRRPWEWIKRDEVAMRGGDPSDLRLRATGVDGRVFPLRSLAYVSEERYLVYLNVSFSEDADPGPRPRLKSDDGAPTCAAATQGLAAA